MNRYQKSLLVGAGVGAAAGVALWLYKATRAEADFKGRVALVTGGSRGLGFLLARELLRRGAIVAICARDEAELFHAEAKLGEEGQVKGFVCDLREPDQIDTLCDEVEARFGRVEILVNNAGVIEVGPLATVSLKDYATALDTTLWASLRLTQRLLPAMRRRQSGHIINITSLGGMLAVPHLLPYCTAKFAAFGWSQGLHAEAKRDHVTVTTVAPGTMRTGSQGNAMFSGDNKREYQWFTMAASLPFLSVDAEVAAKDIIEAAAKGKALAVIGLPAQIAAKLGALFPGLTAQLMTLANQFLPVAKEISGERVAVGDDLRPQARGAVFDFMTTLGEAARHRFQRLEHH